MGLFENLGRKVEQFKQEAVDSAAEDADYECADCGTLVYGERDDCPECGGDDLVPVAETTSGDGRDD